MGQLIAITGKGGVGKTTVAGLAVRALIEAGRTPVLAVDADPNSCLDVALGVTARASIGRIREEARETAAQGLGAGISKQQLLELRIAESLVESRSFDLIAMGRPEGAGCYCYANNVLKDALKKLAVNYKAVVLDNEAGLENLSRRIAAEVDLLVLVGDATYNGLHTLERLHQLAKEMDVRFRRLALVVNRTRGEELPPAAAEMAGRFAADAALALPFDPEISDFSETGRTIFELPGDNRSLARLASFLGGILA